MAARSRLNTFLSKYLYSRSSRAGTLRPSLVYFMLRFMPHAMARLKNMRTTGLACDTLSLMAVYTFSQKRGTLHMQVG